VTIILWLYQLMLVSRFHRNEEIATSYQQVGFIAVKRKELVSHYPNA